jgi:cytoskeletal protein CcmA (bactofilin family)
MSVPKGFSLQAIKLPKPSALFSRFFERSARPHGEESIDSVVSSGMIIRGDIAFTGVLRVDGYIEGRLEAQSDQALLVVGETATLRGDVSAVDAIICGLVEGNVVVQRFLELRPGARVIGDVTYCQIEMHVGASVDGRMVHAEDNTIQALVVPTFSRA